METQFFNALAQFVGENWAGFIVAACIAVCALAQTLMAPPTESSSAIYKIIYAVTAKFGGNFGKARNAVHRRPGQARQDGTRRPFPQAAR